MLPRVMVLDDDPNNGRIIQQALAEVCQIEAFEDDEEALKWLSTTALDKLPQLILLDVNMPNRSGLEVCALLKDDIKTQDIPVIFITGNTDRDLEKACFGAGAVDFLEKPLNMPVVVARVQTQLNLERKTRELFQAKEAALSAKEELQMSYDSLRRAQVMLQESNISSEIVQRQNAAILSNISQNFRAPLSALMGTTTLLQRTTLNAEQKEYADTMDSVLKTLSELVSEVMGDSEVLDELTVEHVPFNLDQSIEQMADLLKPRANDKGVGLEIRIPAEVPQNLKGDPGRIRQVLLALANNAIKYSVEGTVTISVDAASDTDGKAELTFSVIDQGIGVDEAVLDDLLNTKSAPASHALTLTGSGLSTEFAKGMINKLGGKLSARRNDEAGSTFWFTLKFDLCPEREVAMHPHFVNSDQRVLIVEHYYIHRWLISEQLSRWGIEHTHVGSGRAALDELISAKKAGRPYQLVILDKSLCDLSDDEFVASIRRQGSFDQLRLMLYTALPQKGDAGRYHRMGVHVYLPKPASERQFKGMILAALKTPIKRLEKSMLISHADTSDDASKPTKRVEQPVSAKVLLVEDEIVNRRVESRLLTKIGCVVDVIADGEETVSMWKLGRYDIIFMDLHMPQMDGFQATQQIRFEERTHGLARTPVVALTASDSKEEMERCKEVGMDGFLQRPVSVEQLREVILSFKEESAQDSGAVES